MLFLLLALGAAAASHAMSHAAEPGAALELQTPAGALKIEPWGTNALRVRAVVTGGGAVKELPGALITPGSDNKGAPLAGGAAVEAAVVAVAHSFITNGNIAATVNADGLVTVSRVSDGLVAAMGGGAVSLLAPSPLSHWPASSNWKRGAAAH